MIKRVFLKEYVKLYTVKQLFEYAVKNHGEKAAYCFKKNGQYVEKTYNEVWREICNLSGYLINSGYTGKKIALVGNASYEWLVSFFAVMNAGAVAVTLDKELKDEDLLKRIEFSDSSVLLYSKDYDSLKELCGSSVVCISFDEILKHMSELCNVSCETAPDDAALFCFTSGTTSYSKCVMLSHKNIVSNSICGAITRGFTDNGKLLAILPLNHSFAVAQLVAAIYGGSAVAINESMKYFMQDMKYYKPTLMLVVPLVVNSIYRQIQTELKKKNKLKTVNFMRKFCKVLCWFGIDIRDKVFGEIKNVFGGNLDTLICGGAYLDPEKIIFFREIGINILQGYGITECAPVVAVNTDYRQKIDAVGYIMPYNEIRIVNDEVQVKGDNVMLGYYKDENATASAFDGDWFKTGDIGSVDEDNFLYITGRLKNMIVLPNGENVIPEELESMIEKFEIVSEVIVKESDGVLCAEVFLDESISMEKSEKEKLLKEEINQLNRKLPLHHNIRKIEFRDKEFEKNSSKKIKRY